MPQSSRPSGQSGFSLIELIIAVAVTLVITGAVYGLMAGGNNAFRREPELTDRQQNARVAMDLIQKDISNAGVNMGPFFQSFTRNLNGAGRITGPSGQVADHLETFGNDGTCPDAPAANPPTNGVNFVTLGHIPDCYGEDAMVLVVFTNGGAKWGLGHNIHAQDKMLNFPGGAQPPDSQMQNLPADLKSYVPGNPASGVPQSLSPLNLVRYEIAPDLVDGVPSLYRSPTGGRNPADGTILHAPTTAAGIAAGRWQIIARGIEDLQVQYRNGTNRNGTGWDNDPGNSTCLGSPSSCVTPSEADYNRGVREVRVTISARAEGQNLQGQTASLAAGAGSRANAVRGSVTSVTTVKALQVYLSQAGPTAACPTCPVWR
jgi:prepilin-type N-terminal cleavage/methylation domain-containing protein